ncbi:hypothetical protein ACTZWW_08265 [Salinarimonas sp. NSM]|uniref:hypothetical protein n=1 Tax=Salinarimonas sp. NSM TaxID=3458003 RepID=UPI0040354D05
MSRLARHRIDPPEFLAAAELAPGGRTAGTGHVPLDPTEPPAPLPPGGRLPSEVPPLPEKEEPGADGDLDGDPTIRDPGRRMPPDHLPGGPTNPNPHHAGRHVRTP